MLKAEIRRMFKRLEIFDGRDLDEFQDAYRRGRLNLVQEYVSVHQAYIMTMIVLVKMYQKGVKHV